MRLSWSAIKDFMHCHRKYQLGYIEGLVKPDSSDSTTKVIGSHVHAAWEHAMLGVAHDGFVRMSNIIEDGLYGLRNYRAHTLDNNKVIWDYETQQFVPDTGYFTMMEVAFETARAVIEYQMPRFDWNRYRPATLEDLFGEAATDVLGLSPGLKTVTDPLIEWKFEIPLFGITPEKPDADNEHVLVGVIDAVVWDNKQNEFVFLDWKTRRTMPDEQLVALDGQLPLYASIINYLAGKLLIRRVVMYQFSSNTPNGAKLTQRGEVSKAIPGSTWDVWSSSVRSLGFNPEQYREEMEPKCQPETHYTLPVSVAINEQVVERMIIHLQEVIIAMQAAYANDNFPGILSLDQGGCAYCWFKNICHVYQGGGDPQLVIDREYMVKRGFEELETAT